MRRFIPYTSLPTRQEHYNHGELICCIAANRFIWSISCYSFYSPSDLDKTQGADDRLSAGVMLICQPVSGNGVETCRHQRTADGCPDVLRDVLNLWQIFVTPCGLVGSHPSRAPRRRRHTLGGLHPPNPLFRAAMPPQSLCSAVMTVL